MLIYKEHRQEMMKDTDGKPHPIFSRMNPNAETFWDRVIGVVLTSSHVELEIFAELRRQAEELRCLQDKYAGKLSPLEDLPEDYLVAILRFRFFLGQMAKEWLKDLKTTVASSPPMRHLFVREPAQDYNKILIKMKPGVKLNAVEKEVVWLLQTLWEDGRNLFLARLPMVVDELERLLRAEPRAREMISGYIAERIGSLSILCECLRQLDIYQPWANGFETASVDREDGITKDLETWRENWAWICSTLKSRPMMVHYKLGEPSGKRFFYPTEKRRTKETVEALRQAEANLDTFWEKFDKCLDGRTEDLGRTALGGLLSQSRTLQRTPEWVAPAVPERGKMPKPEPVLSVDDAVYRPLSTIHFASDATASGTAAQPKQKVKTRGAANPASPKEQQQLADAVTSLTLDQRPRFSVDARALRVFRMLFFQAAVTSTPGEVSWNDFLHAMTSTGFRAEKLYGSVWHFQPSRLNVERGIQFHEPHPVAKIPFTTARRIGRRLARAYGWVGSMFVLREK